ncbi:galactose-binding domain-like protein [Clohesyomyces aquaticus]|uniref:Galactose-binding domain-like protein n=1 Tax=Clohesyomyces aquaticus TaxID=1231657 RepID=A0A1Y1ZG73_9PLEO|nr:galactose-binding domain-like protein [Clohesyomyces aquaticus]
MDGVSTSGIKWYTTTFDLKVNQDLDVPIGVELGAPAKTVARVLLFVNGYQHGKYVSHIGPQTLFPLPPGILNTDGENTLSIALWAQTDAGAKLSTVRLFEYARYESGFGFGKISGRRLQPTWQDRSRYA